MPPRIIVFDLGGVVVRICRSWKEACDRCSLPYHDTVTNPAFVAERKAIRASHEIGRMTDEEFYTRIAATTGGHYTPQQVRDIHHNWTIDEYPGVTKLVDDLHDRGLATGVLSNTNAHHWRLLTEQPQAGGPAPYPTVHRVHHLHASHLLGLAKPHRAIYEAFGSRAGYAPHDILFFDDLAENITGAQDAGWDAVQIDHTGDTAAQMRLHLRLRGVDV
ncbi:MAG TPA: HAD-IA family hydrolase [Phycisphaerales bacterium]|nr:HAD-IA family hydrolase [Phycisphaerales bacterium]